MHISNASQPGQHLCSKPPWLWLAGVCLHVALYLLALHCWPRVADLQAEGRQSLVCWHVQSSLGCCSRSSCCPPCCSRAPGLQHCRVAVLAVCEQDYEISIMLQVTFADTLGAAKHDQGEVSSKAEAKKLAFYLFWNIKPYFDR